MMNPIYEFLQRNHALAKIEYARKNKQATLVLEDLDLTDVPEALLHCAKLTMLYMPKNNLRKLPTLTTLKNLHTLSLDYNDLDHFPEPITQLTQLRYLNVSHNPMKTLCPQIGKLVELLSLWCTSCCLTSLPEEIGQMKSLDTLGARNNLFTDLPDGLCKLTQLSWLTLENNKLMQLPQQFGKIKSLKHLNLNKNQFNCVPIEMVKLKKMRYLFMQNNDIFTLDYDVISRLRHIHRINLMHNPIVTSKEVAKNYPNLLLHGTNWDPSMDTSDESTWDDSSENWEDSVDSSDLGMPETDSETDDEEVLGDYLPKTAKFLVMY